MKKYFLFSIVVILFLSRAFSQTNDLPTLESLKKQVSNLKDTALVNCLNLISYNFSIIGFGPGSADFIRRSDSIFHYANVAFKVAKKINYKKGMADALTQLASSENIKGFGLRLAKKNDSATTVASKNYLLSAIAIAKENNAAAALGEAYYRWPSETGDDNVDYMKKSLPYFKKAGNERMEGEICTWIGENYFYKGFYENAIEYCQRGLILNHKTLEDARTKEEQNWRYYLYQQSLSDMADLYKAAGDYQSSLEYLNLANQFGIEKKTGWTTEREKGEIFRLTGQYDSSFYYLRKTDDKENAWGKREIAATYVMTNQYDSALTILKQIEPIFRKTNPRGGNLIPVLFYEGSAYAGKNKYNYALLYAREGISNAEYLGRRVDMMTGYELLSRIHHHLGNNDSAYYYLDKYIILKDSIQNRQFLFRMNNYKKAAEDEKKKAQIGFLNRDNKIKVQQLKQEGLIKKVLISGLILIILIGIFIFRTLTLKRKNDRLGREQLENEMKVQQLESEKKQSDLQRQAADLEMQALRAQMNPHFIFNCLSSINKFILKNESRTASDYLTRFSRLIRMVLTNSQLSMIPLSDEIEMLRLYLDMEHLRFNNSFDYNIVYANAIEPETIYIPPMVLQPFCENAIWHGLMHKEGQGRLDIIMSMQNEQLKCTITDNGIGRTKAAELKSKSGEKQKSFGLKITTERLALFNNEKAVRTFYNSEDVLDSEGNISGTEVTLYITFKDDIHEPVSLQ